MSGLPEPVLVVGTGLIGTSLALALRRLDVPVWLADRDPRALGVAVGMGAGDPLPAGGQPGLVVVAVPPAETAALVAAALAEHPGAIVTDVASVKVPIMRALVAAGADTSRYVGGHPMAGREVSGAAAARADLIDDRPWVITPHPQASPVAVEAVQELALTARALPVMMPAEEHDAAVAVVSHAPQVVSSLLAARLLDSSDTAVSIAGQGIRDMTRIAASDPRLWEQILAANAVPVVQVLSALREDLDRVVGALAGLGAGGDLAAAGSVGAGGDLMAGSGGAGAAAGTGLGGAAVVGEVLRRGNEGRDRIPGKHGARSAPTVVVPVAVPDEPGQLGRLFAAVADAGFSVEDVRIEHVLGRPTGVVEMSVDRSAAGPLSAALLADGWDVRA